MSAADRIVRVWNARLSRGWFVGLWVVIAGLCLLRAQIGMNAMRFCTHDLFVFLDGAWRVLNHQIPYKDFLTDMGPAIHLMNALGITLAGGPRGLAYAQSAFGGLAGPARTLLTIATVMPW